jgi:hypothetical protein
MFPEECMLFVACRLKNKNAGFTLKTCRLVCLKWRSLIFDLASFKEEFEFVACRFILEMQICILKSLNAKQCLLA